jgi:diguanylate cyclase (GGDEF)-like protein/PAS domain S-box-containing protein
MNDFMQGLLLKKREYVELQIFDGDKPLEEALLYPSGNMESVISHSDRVHFATYQSVLGYAGRRWFMVFKSTPYFESTIDTGQVNSILALGSIISLLLFFVLLSLIKSRSQALSLANITLDLEKANFGLKREVVERKQTEETIHTLNDELEEKVRARTQQLADSQALLRGVFDSVQDGIIVAEAQTRQFKMVNASICRMLGYSADEMLQLGMEGIHPADQLAYVISQFERPGKGEVGIAPSVPMLRKDGSIFYADASSGLMTINGVASVVGAFRDITERKQAEEKILGLNQSLEQKVQQLLDAQETLEQHRAHLELEVAQRTASLTQAQRIAHLGNWEWDIASDTLRWSDEIYRIFGLAPQQFGASYEAFLNAVHPEDRQLVEDSVREALAGRPRYSIEHRILQPDGTLRHVHEQAEVIRGKDGQPISMLGTVQDITARKQAEQTVMDEKNFSNTLIQSLPDIFFLLDHDGGLLQWNKQFEVLLGLSPEEISGINVLSINHEDDRPRAIQAIQQAFETGSATLEARLVLAEGVRDYLLTATRIETKLGVNLIGFGTDITERKQMEAALRDSEIAHRTLSQNLPGMVYRVFVREGGRMQFYNAMPVQITGYTLDELTTGKVCSIEPLILNEDRPGVEAEVKRAIAENRAFTVEYRLKHKDGGIRWMEEHGMPVYDTDSALLYIDGVIFDITEHKQDEIKLQLFRTLLDNSRDAIEVIDPATMRFLDVNETECRELGYSREELLTMSVTDIETEFTENQVLEFKAQILQNGEGIFESTHRRKDDTTYPVEVRAKMIKIGQPYMLSIVRDITERKLADAQVQQLQDQLREQALHDPLTGLHNRRYLDEAIGRELIRSARNKQPIGIVMCDLDHFKLVNDTYGHLVGDEILRVFAELLKKHARGSDIVCRFGGEEFVLFLPDMPPAVAYQRAEQLRTSLAALQIGKEGIRVTASFGVAAFPENGKTMDSLIGAVDAAMYQAKEAGRNRVVVASAHEEDVSGRT